MYVLMERIFKNLRGKKAGRGLPKSLPAQDVSPAVLAGYVKPGTEPAATPEIPLPGSDPSAPVYDAVPEAAASNAVASTWSAKRDTYLKKSTKLASALNDDEKHLARPGDVLTGLRYAWESGHHKVSNATLNQEPIGDGWFLFPEHWTEEISSPHP